MVHLNKIYTRFGDAGLTQLGDGSSVFKTTHRVSAMGDVDELNCQIGVALTIPATSEYDSKLTFIQNQLFDLGADLCVPESPSNSNPEDKLRILDTDVTRLENWIDELNTHLEPLRSFILPGGSARAAHLHLARGICRRAERSCWLLQQEEEINSQIMIYLNRLSDFLFVLARLTNQLQSVPDVLWQPASKRS